MKSTVFKKFCEFEKKGGVFPLLPSFFLWIGLSICVISIVAMIFTATQSVKNPGFYKDFFMHLILIGLFMITLVKDKNEDERIKKLRYRAFAFAFVLGTFTFLLMPFAILIKDVLLNESVIEWGRDQSFFFIISSYLFYYLMYFQIFKRQL
ncbi:hypothetical protein [Nonlabens sp.]|uniref:hypothetical protein n=1 Tax=Nonlabens sp. TaxID=1888209 RepID=UPI003F6A14AC